MQYCSFICQDALARRQQTDLFSWVKLPSVTTSLTTLR